MPPSSSADRPLAASDHWLDYASVTTTENFVLCAAMARGRSRLINAACEPHVQEFCAFLGRMGARIAGSGSSRLEVEGVEALGGAEYTFDDDFHEVATFLALSAITGGDVAVKQRRGGAVPAARPQLRQVRRRGRARRDGFSRARVARAFGSGRRSPRNLMQKVEAAPWPYVPADLLPIFVALGARAEGRTMFWNKVYEGALGWSRELAKFGVARHAVRSAPTDHLRRRPLVPATVESPYIIRVAIALFMVAASIDGRSTIRNAAADPPRSSALRRQPECARRRGRVGVRARADRGGWAGAL